MKMLQGLGIPNFLLHWISDFVSESTQIVKVGTAISDSLQIWGPIPQGTNLGVFLFILMINDLHTEVPTFKYVDDTPSTISHMTPKSTKPKKQWTQLRSGSQIDMKINQKKPQKC